MVTHPTDSSKVNLPTFRTLQVRVNICILSYVSRRADFENIFSSSSHNHKTEEKLRGLKGSMQVGLKSQ